MKIIGVGVDIIENKRIKKSILNSKFINRMFTINEIKKSKSCKNKTAYFSKRFAAKEAFAKALGTGFRNKLNFKDISIINDKLGKPKIEINNKIKSIILKKIQNKKN